MDLVGSITQNFDHRKYFLTVVDDFSRFTWVKYLIKKSDAFMKV